MFRLLSRKTTATRLCPPSFRRGLRLEWLEDRANPATFFVDDGLVAGADIANLNATNPGYTVVDQNSNGTLDTGDLVRVTLPGANTTTDFTFESTVPGTVNATDNLAFGTLAAALTAANSVSGTDTVYVGPGTYAESLNVNSAVNLIGVTGTATDVAISPSSGDGIAVSADGVSLQNLLVTGAANGITGTSAVTSLTLNNVTVGADNPATSGTTESNTGTGLLLTGPGTTGTLTLNLTDVTLTGNATRALNVGGYATVDLNVNGLSVTKASGATASAISFDGSLANATLNVALTGATGQTVTVTGTSLQLGSGEAISLANVDNLNLTGTAGNDTFVVTPPATGGTVITVDGGAGTDTLHLTDTTGLTVNSTYGTSGFSGTVSSGSTTTVNFSHVESFTGGATVSGTVYADTNSNGTQDANEGGLPGVTVFLDANGNNTLDTGEITAVTDSTGAYTLTGLPPGSYTVRAVAPAGATLTGTTTPAAVTVSSLGQAVTGPNFTVSLTAGGTATGVLFGDTNGNGTRQAGENPISGSTVYLDLNGNGVLDANEPADVTGADGVYALSTTQNGTFTLRVQSLPSGFTNPSPLPTVALSGGATATQDFGLVPTSTTGTAGGTVSGFVFVDANHNGTADVGEGKSGVTVFLDANGNGTLDSGETSATTDANGHYSLTATANGTYTVAVQAPSGFTLVGSAPVVTLSGGTTVSNENIQLQAVSAQTGGTVSGFVFVDANHNGTPDSGEGKSGVTVFLDANGNGTLDSGEASATTDANGHYSLTATANGTYTVAVQAPSGFTLVGSAPTVALSGGNTITGKNIQLQPVSTGTTGGTVSGTVFADVVDTNGSRDAGENGVRGITVYLDLNNNGKLDQGEPTAITDANGAYTLTTTQDVTSAAVRAVLSPGYLRSTSAPLVSLTGGTSLPGKDIGLVTNLPPQATPSRRLAAGYVVGGQAHVKVFDDAGHQLSDLTVFQGLNTQDVRVAVADVTGDGVDDVVVGTGPGVPTQVVVLDGTTLQTIATITPFESSFTGGVYVAVGDVNHDGINDVIVSPDQGGGPRVLVYQGGAPGSTGAFTQLASFFGIDDSNFRGGARVSVADVNRDGVPDLIVAAGFGGGPRVAVYDGNTILTGIQRLFNDFFVFEQTLRNGVYITAGDLDGDGYADLIAGGGPGGGPRVLALNGHDLLKGHGIDSHVLANFFAGDSSNRGGVRVVAKDTDGDGRAEIYTGAGDDESGKVRKFHHDGSEDNSFEEDFGGNHGVHVG